jgi:AcrR family transcriptional regulator
MSRLEAGPGRGRDAAATREAILEAAGRAFTARGFDGVGVREIAAAAGCNAALVNRYFGGKETLFAEVMARAVGIDALLDGPRGEFGTRLAGYLVAKEKATRTFDPMLAGLRSATGETAIGIVREVMEAQLSAKLARWLGGRRSRERAALIVGTMAGFDLMRSVVGAAGTERRRDRELAALLARAIQSYVDNDA